MNSNDKAAAAWNDYVSQQQEEKIEELERELNASNQRIKRLEDAGDLLARMVFRQDGYGIYQDEEDAVNGWDKAKECK